ncbi:sensor histidine kinase [Lactobacillus gasseri]|uniref:sensor histidine kinase n=1 Tax=Lactobacillus gasseri TaxID=1596 RepID=UPI0023A9E340|nr:HAMP domain-containing sensor histidine kinase [Lactobacillus gasseri]WEA89331.1 HAMP domain-containing sensor histidine kinase [Lactobacillus gasseri]
MHFATIQAYSQSYSRLEGYGTSIGKLALAKDNPRHELDAKFLKNLQVVMEGEDVNLRIFNNKNRQVYPETKMNWALPQKLFKQLKNGKTIRIRNDHEDGRVTSFSNKDAYTSVIVPWRSNGKLVGVIWIGSRVQNVEQMIVREKHNLITALLSSLVIGGLISFILSYYISRKIKLLSSATKKVAQGDFNVHLKHKDTDEIDDLARNFNIMVNALKESNDEIKAQEKRREQFMADAAHEMRTPLTTINGLLEGFEYDAIPEEAKPKSIALMHSETKRLIRLVNENLDYEKIRNNKISLIQSRFNATEVLTNLLTQMKQKAIQKNDKLILDCPSEVEVYADKDRFTQIMVNLVQNALQFTENGKIKISAWRIKHGAQFEIADTGIGMSQKQMKYIFERFYKADPSRAKIGSGESGLGLSIVLSLIKQHGGKIDVDSEPGKGAKFTVTLYDKGYKEFIKD